MAPLAFHEKEDAMTLARAREIIVTQLQFGGGYNRNAVRLLLGGGSERTVNQQSMA